VGIIVLFCPQEVGRQQSPESVLPCPDSAITLGHLHLAESTANRSNIGTKFHRVGGPEFIETGADGEDSLRIVTEIALRVEHIAMECYIGHDRNHSNRPSTGSSLVMQSSQTSKEPTTHAQFLLQSLPLPRLSQQILDCSRLDLGKLIVQSLLGLKIEVSFLKQDTEGRKKALKHWLREVGVAGYVGR
jgi:hypothetical protein